MVDAADVVVVGAGVMGCSIAYYLKKKGVKTVAVVERRGIGEEASGSCDGTVFLQTKAPGVAMQQARRSIEIYDTLSRELGNEVYFQKFGGLVLIDSEELMKTMEHIVSQQIENGIEVEIISGDRAREMEPCLSRQVIAAAYCPDDARISPIDVTLAYAKAAARLGVQFILNTAVTQIRTQQGEVVGVMTEKGEIKTGRVINACGVYAPEIGRMVGLDIPIIPRKGQLIVTEQIAPCIHANLTCARYIALKHNPELAQTSDDPFFRMGVSLIVEQSHHGNIIIGSNREWGGFDTSTSYEILRAICNYSTNLVPFLGDLNIIRTFAGLRPYCEGGPVLGPVDGIEGFIMAAGHEGDGIALAPITGEIISDYAIDGRITDDIRPYLLSRFAKN
jgi:glycine/D-amino acid oxidase-like deaminating enzyme